MTATVDVKVAELSLQLRGLVLRCVLPDTVVVPEVPVA